MICVMAKGIRDFNRIIYRLVQAHHAPWAQFCAKLRDIAHAKVCLAAMKNEPLRNYGKR